MAEIGIGCFIGSLAFFMIYCIFVIYQKAFVSSQKEFSFKNSYPYELYFNMSIPQRVFVYSMLFLSVGLGSVGFIFAFQSLLTSYALIIGIAYGVSYIALAISNVLPLTFYKSHIFSALFGLFGFAFASILLCFITVIPSGMLMENLDLPVVIIAGVFGFIVLLSCFNPKLLLWGRMDKTEEDGKTYYLKPKINYLALYEWVLFLLYNITILMVLISLAV